MLEEIFQLQFHGKMCFTDIYNLPISRRKWFITRTIKEIEQINKEIEHATKQRR